MAFVRQNTSNATFMAWGVPKGENSYTVKEKETIEVIVTDIRENDTYKQIFELKSKATPKTLTMLGNTALLRLTGYSADNVAKADIDPTKIYTVQVGDKLQITYKGKVKTKKGQLAYTFDVAVDDTSESYQKFLKARKK
ncbi:unnamed protein product [marine sediment metagenome]|uniref:Uncharacterized protein n=1 Tax=marine sediment metagenome TaxID=412755 RepID=X0X6G7_9ZZZZ